MTTQALGRSRGGFSTKVHLAVDARGQPVEFRLGPGQEHDSTRAAELLADHAPKTVIADKGYDADELVTTIAARGATAVIPPRSNRNNPRTYDRAKYKHRNLIERCVNRLKHYRRMATRYEKSARNDLSFVHISAALMMLGVTVNTA